MEAAQLAGGAAVGTGLSNLKSKWTFSQDNSYATGLRRFHYGRVNLGRLRDIDASWVGSSSVSLSEAAGFLNYSLVRRRTGVISRLHEDWNSDCGVKSRDDEDSPTVQEESSPTYSNGRHHESNGCISAGFVGVNDNLKEAHIQTFQPNDVRGELLKLSLPAMGGQAIEPLGQLMETAYIGHLGSVELASAGISISLFNIIAKLFNIPLLSVATSFVAKDISKNAKTFSTSGEKMQLSSVSTALLLAVAIGIFESIALSLGSGPLLSLMGISPDSSMWAPAQQFLTIRAFGAPAFVVSLALQGIFRGFKDTTTPIFCLGFGNFAAVFLYPLLIYYFQMGVNGAAISTIISQYIVTFSMIWNLNKRAVLLPPKLRELQFGGYLKSGGFLIGRTLAVLLTITLGTSMAARQGPTAMAAHQICLQVWLAVSLLTDAVAASAQLPPSWLEIDSGMYTFLLFESVIGGFLFLTPETALIASYISRDNFSTVKYLTQFVLKIGLVLGVFLALVLGVSFSSLALLFTKETQVLAIVRTGVLFVSASQPINALAFICDGLHYGVSDFPYAAFSMMLVGAISCAYLLTTPASFGLPGVWFGLTLFMGLRMVAGLIRLSDRGGPWWFLHSDVNRVKVAA